jgi:hypothetical protein
VKTQTTQSRLDQALVVLKSDAFVHRRGTGNELGFFVFDYPPEDELLVRDELQDRFLRRLQEPGSPLRPVLVDLYDEVLGLLGERGVLDKIGPMEEAEGFPAVLEKLQRGVLRPENIVRRIMARITPEHTLLILSGAGRVYPLLRSHTILNNLHDPLAKMTVLLMFPGVYDQKELRLFGRLKDDNYYRAFRLVGDLQC